MEYKKENCWCLLPVVADFVWQRSVMEQRNRLFLIVHSSGHGNFATTLGSVLFGLCKEEDEEKDLQKPHNLFYSPHQINTLNTLH